MLLLWFFFVQVRNADQIVVIADHSVSAMGTHGSLLESSTVYADLVKRQLSAGMEKLPPPDISEEKTSDDVDVVVEAGIGPSAVL